MGHYDIGTCSALWSPRWQRVRWDAFGRDSATYELVGGANLMRIRWGMRLNLSPSRPMRHADVLMQCAVTMMPVTMVVTLRTSYDDDPMLPGEVRGVQDPPPPLVLTHGYTHQLTTGNLRRALGSRRHRRTTSSAASGRPPGTALGR